MGFDMTEGKVSRWLKKIGDPVKRGETIGEIETEKATVDLSAPVDGVFIQILVREGETVPVNTPIAVIAAPGEQVQAQPQQPEPAAPPAPAPRTQEPPAQPSAALEQERAQEEAPVTSTTPEPETTVSTAPAPQPSPAKPAPVQEGDGRIKASPVARNMALAEGIDLKTIKGSGPGGRIIERDVVAAIQALKQGAPQAVPAPRPAAPTPRAPAAPAPTTAAAPLAPGEHPLSKMRQTIARRLLESKTTIPHYYLTLEIFMGEAMKLREQLNAMAANDSEKLSVNDIIIAAAARTLTKFPNVNAYFKGDRMILNDKVNIGIAVAVEDGLLTPVMHDVPNKTLKQIAVESKELAARARANKLKPEDLGPGTFTVSNLGMYGIEDFAAIINPPESAILAVGAVKPVPVVIDDSIQIAQVMKVTLSADHRIVDGAMGARFLQELKKVLENPVNLLLR